MKDKACGYYKKYKGIREPKCGCKPCWRVWAYKQAIWHLRKELKAIQ